MDAFVYLDNNSTTRVDPRVFDIIKPYFTNLYGNAASNHTFGVEVNQGVKEARATLANGIGAENNELIFTSGATEAINLALRGTMKLSGKKGKHLITVTNEHPAVLDTCRYLETEGYEVTYLPVSADGLVDLEVLKIAIRQDTVLVSVMLVNNETGVIQPIKEIAEIAHQYGAFFMTDATQAFGKMHINVDEIGIDLMAFSAHKFYGPKGVGGLFVRNRRPHKVKLEALIHGGGHEKGYRSGTLNVPGIVGMGKAAEIAWQEMDSDRARIGALRDKLESQLLAIEGSFLNGNPDHRLYNTISIGFKGADANAVMIGLKDVIVSNGSACSSTKIEPSHVLIAMGRSEQEAYSTLRISLGRFTTDEDVHIAAERIKEEVEKLRKSMPVF
ncbi:cysteine desulfurase [Parapedobacter luteus]|uniref:cysteine desulfurase n=1 Tax=Parapedobacter luteus TaxID=623280 RepID=A0A1T5CU06_9SPHI|nr:cysteine desulfurase family protein [Parapedobacter luteus]SKB62670.1 cysteine desulfurase [Parapedobacter luteus]